MHWHDPHMGLRLAAALTAALLAGCAAYRPLPLDSAFPPPEQSALLAAAQQLRHPLLPPIPFNPADGLSPDEAAVLAVVANPDLHAQRQRRGVAAAQLLQAGILPNPQLSYGMGFPTGGAAGAVTAFDLGLNWQISTLLGRGARMAAARSGEREVDLEIAWREWQVAQMARLTVLRLLTLDRQLALVAAAQQELEESREALRRAVELGEKTAPDLAAGEAAALENRLALLELQQQREKERLQLNRLVGQPPARELALQAAPAAAWNPLPTLAEATADLEHRRPDLLALRAGYESQEARVRAAVQAQFPRIEIGLTRARDTDGVRTAGFGVVLGLPIFDRQQGEIARQRATRRQLGEEYAARLFEARSQAAELLAEMGAVQRRIAAADATLPSLRRLAQLYRQAAASGTRDILLYYGARKDLTARELELSRLRETLAELGVGLETAAGRYFPAAGDGRKEVKP